MKVIGIGLSIMAYQNKRGFRKYETSVPNPYEARGAI
jgi:hypothetical protein